MNEQLNVIPGDISCDDRGKLRFVNEFNPMELGIKRMYQVENNDTNIIRGFHGHLNETKYVYVSKGSIKLIVCKLDDDGGVSKTYKEYILSSEKPTILCIHGGYAHGFKALEYGTIVQFFSTSTLEESKSDDYRFSWDSLGVNVWKTENR